MQRDNFQLFAQYPKKPANSADSATTRPYTDAMGAIQQHLLTLRKDNVQFWM